MERRYQTHIENIDHPSTPPETLQVREFSCLGRLNWYLGPGAAQKLKPVWANAYDTILTLKALLSQ